MSHRKARLLRLLGVAAVVVAAVVTALVGGAGYRPHAEAVARPLLTQPRSAHAATQPRPTSQCLTVYGIHCYSPAQFENAYDLAPLQARGVDGSGTDDRHRRQRSARRRSSSDLHQFDQTFGVSNPWGIPVDPAIANDPKLTIIQPAGPVPPFDPTNDDMVGWAEETTLDVEWAHVFAPKANILLVETPVSETEGVTGFPEMSGRELRDRPPPGRRDLAELRRDREDLPERAIAAAAPLARSRTPRRRASRCSAPRATRDRRTSS